jgi:hypothetical protein
VCKKDFRSPLDDFRGTEIMGKRYGRILDGAVEGALKMNERKSSVFY